MTDNLPDLSDEEDTVQFLQKGNSYMAAFETG